MIASRKIRLGGVPCVFFYDHTPEQAASHGTVLFYHGLGAGKDGQTKEFELLAKAGFLTVGVDNVGHGERRYPHFDDYFGSQNPAWGKNFLDAVWATVQEIPMLLDELQKMGLLREGKIAVGGISMGGYITYGSPLVDKRITAITPILGSPHWRQHPNSPKNHPQAFYPVALLSQTAGADEHVPPKHAAHFHEVLKPYYAASPERLAYVEFPGAKHFMPEKDWTTLSQNMLGWLQKFLVGK